VGQAGAGNQHQPPPVAAPTCSAPAPPPGPCGTPATCVNGEWTRPYVSCNPPPIAACPTVMPEIGTSCAGQEAGGSCNYGYCYDASVPQRRCNGSTWLWEEIPVPTCNPPPPTNLACATTMPVPGSDCSFEDQVCGYPGCEGPAASTATCRFGQWWVVYSGGPACNPPAVVPVCPEREIVGGQGCAYEEQVCFQDACAAGAEVRIGYQCVGGAWQGELFACAPDAGAPDGGG
jgi:hypothetical protein